MLINKTNKQKKILQNESEASVANVLGGNGGKAFDRSINKQNMFREGSCILLHLIVSPF